MDNSQVMPSNQFMDSNPLAMVINLLMASSQCMGNILSQQGLVNSQFMANLAMACNLITASNHNQWVGMVSHNKCKATANLNQATLNLKDTATTCHHNINSHQNDYRNY